MGHLSLDIHQQIKQISLTSWRLPSNWEKRNTINNKCATYVDLVCPSLMTYVSEAEGCRVEGRGCHRAGGREVMLLGKVVGTGLPVHACRSLWSCLTLHDPMDCSLPSSSVHGILQTSVLEWVATSSSRGSSRPRDWTHISYVSYTGRWVLTSSATW